jgi:CBS domain-containing protein
MDVSGLERIDSFPYRHRVADVMRAPAVTAPPAMTLAEGVRRMNEAGVSSLVVTANGRPVGIVTERDLLRAVAERGGGGLALSLSAIMSSPVETVAPDVFVYVALARMARRGLRHLAVIDHDGRLAGVVTAGALLRQRAGHGLALADEVQRAEDPAAMAAVMHQMPALARGLLAEGTEAREVAAVISAVVRDITARSAELAEAKLVEEGLGPPPAPYACLVLGSAGRGESLLVPDQDNAVVHAGDADDAPWFAAFGRHLADLLDAAGVPYCKGKVMASEPLWRHTLAGWEDLIDRWVGAPKPEDLLNVDIFFDFVPVHGDRALAARLRSHATEVAARAPAFLRLLAEAMKSMHPPFGLFGGVRTKGGRVDLKAGGLLPLVTGARLMALKCASPATSTLARLAAARESGALNAEDAAGLAEGHELLLGLVLDQQITDVAAGTPPSTKVELARLARPLRRRLVDVLREIDTIEVNVRDVLTR